MQKITKFFMGIVMLFVALAVNAETKTIKVQWPEEAVTATGADAIALNDGFYAVGNNSKVTLTKNGFYTGGSSSASARYMYFTPSADGVLTVEASASGDNTDRFAFVCTGAAGADASADNVIGKVAIPEKGTRHSLEANLQKDTKYFICLQGNGTITNLSFTYDDAPAEAAGTEADPIILTAGVPAKGPKAATQDPSTYQWTYPTWYQYTATKDGVVKLDLNGIYVMGNIYVGEQSYGYSSSVMVKAGNVVKVNLGAQTDASDKTITLNFREYAEGETIETAKALVEGNNAIANIGNGEPANYYKFAVPAGKKMTITFDGYPSASLLVGEEETKIEMNASYQYEGSYNNAGETETVVYVKVAVLSSACNATVALSDAAPELPAITKMGQPVVYVGENVLSEGAVLDEAPYYLRVMFPETDAQPSDIVNASIMVFETDAEGNPTGSPLNMEKYEYTSNIETGIAVTGVKFEAGKSYKAQLSTVNIREVADLGYRKEYAYSFPNGTENPTNITTQINFSVKGSTATPFDLAGVVMNWKGEEIAAGSEVDALSYSYAISTDKAIAAGEGRIEFKDAEGNGIGVGSLNAEAKTISFMSFGENGYTTPGAYTLVIPAGAIVDAEGNPCNELTATWTVKAQAETGSFAIESVTNGSNEGSDVEALSYTFTINAANAITGLFEGNITLTDAEGNRVGGNARVMGYEGEGGAKTVYAQFTFDSEDHMLHTAGTYTLNIPTGMFVDAEGNKNEAFEAQWIVKEQKETSTFAIESVTNAAGEGEVEALSYMFTINAANAITGLFEGNITLTDAEGNRVGGNARVMGYEGEGGAKTVYAQFTFDSEDHMLHTAGTYTLNIPAGMFVDAEGNKNEAFEAQWIVKEQKETSTFAIESVTNAAGEGEVEALSYMFTINAANAITGLFEGNITLTDAEGNPVGGNARVMGYEGEGGAKTVYAQFTFDSEDHLLHTAGTYTLNIPAGMFVDAEGNKNEAFEAQWTVAPVARAIDTEIVETEGVYTLSGTWASLGTGKAYLDTEDNEATITLEDGVATISFTMPTEAGNHYLYVQENAVVNAEGNYNAATSTVIIVEGPKVEDTELSKDMFCKWDGLGNDANVVATGVGACEWGVSTGLPYGDGSVFGCNYANLKDYDVLALTVTEGTPRLLFNRNSMDDSSSDFLEIKSADNQYVIGVKDNVWYINLAMIERNTGLVHLNCIKGANWANTTITEAKLIVDGSEIVTGIENVVTNAAKANGKYLINGKVVIVKNGKMYNMSGSIIK